MNNETSQRIIGLIPIPLTGTAEGRVLVLRVPLNPYWLARHANGCKKPNTRGYPYDEQ